MVVLEAMSLVGSSLAAVRAACVHCSHAHPPCTWRFTDRSAAPLRPDRARQRFMRGLIGVQAGDELLRERATREQALQIEYWADNMS